MRILVIDDEKPVLKVLERLLSRLGEHEVMTAESASDALYLMDSFRGAFGLILCDVHLTGMDGKEFLSRLSPRDAARIVFMTGGAYEAADQELLSGRQVLLKPIDGEKLAALIHSAPD
jgi:CheY-like chemotaxis protein